MKTVTVEEARQMDRDAVENLGMPSLLLMENASRAVAEAARDMGGCYVVLAGPGNNGGDGLAAARHLGRNGVIHLTAEPDRDKSPDAALQLEILRKAGWPVVVGEAPDPEEHVDAVWIDALFGTGLTRPPEGMPEEWIRLFNQVSGKKLCVDIPSGLHGDTGEVLKTACLADVTVTFGACKVGLTVGDGPKQAGRVIVAPLGIPE